MTFLDDVARALVAAGRSVRLDPDLSTIDVSSASVEKVLAVVRPTARAVTFYVVHPHAVPADRLAAVSELVVRATADLLDASLELDLATGSVAARFGVVLGEHEPGSEDLAELLRAALETVERAGSRYVTVIHDVVSGTLDARTGAVAARTAPLQELSDEIDAR
ncbi:YbjN domain-containing protein [Actinotalea sp. K2]|uniref:YbjN domain-containing protein n=1 Tax=Actinotalea sp. K2 TaxID=2939438 RepID=UPI002017BDCC|nr:YbjN domain-containing protein [Actinotalea sp. K2]MCL3859706.1 YbjN domain-containing protein [Actinotalea sp. K2]